MEQNPLYRTHVKIGHDQTIRTMEPEAQGSLAVAEEKQLLFPEQLPTLKETEQMLITEALRRASGNQTIAAQLLGLSRRTLNNRLSRARKP